MQVTRQENSFEGTLYFAKDYGDLGMGVLCGEGGHVEEDRWKGLK